MFILLLLFLLSSPCFAIDCSIPPPPNCGPTTGCVNSQTQSSQNAVIGGSPSASNNFSGGIGGDWAPIPGQLAWPQQAFNASMPIKDGMYIPPQIILQYKNEFTLEDSKRMSNGMRIKE